MLISLDRHLRGWSPLDWARVLMPLAVVGVVLMILPSSFRNADMLIAWCLASASVLVAAFLAARHPVLAIVVVLAIVAAQAARVIPAVARDDYGYAYVAAILFVQFLAMAGSSAGRWRVAVVAALSVIVSGTMAWIWVTGWAGKRNVLSTWVLGFPGVVPDLITWWAPSGRWVQEQVFFTTVHLTLIMTVFLGAGLLLRSAVNARTTRLELAAAQEAIHERDARTALLDQRRRIAADVHDVLAHSLTVVVAQGEGALVSDERVREESLRRLVEVARSSLRDVRGLIERLDDVATDVPSPGVTDLPRLVDTFAASGLRVTVEAHGHADEVGDATQLAVYRIVQEALTNVLKHGGRGSVALVTLDWRGSAPDLLLTIASVSGADTDPLAAVGQPGVGVSSMQTRAAMTGGWLTAGPTEGGWLVTAQMPTRVLAQEPVEVLR